MDPANEKGNALVLKTVLRGSRHVRGSTLTTDPREARRYGSKPQLRQLGKGNAATRAAWCVLFNACSVRVAAAAFSVSKNRVQRAVERLRLGQPVGKAGRPSRLNNTV